VKTQDVPGSTKKKSSAKRESGSRGTLVVEKKPGASNQSLAASSVAIPLALSFPGSGDSNDKNSKSGANGKNGKNADDSDSLKKRTTIARAVDGIPLGFRAALLALLFTTGLLSVVSWRERRRATNVARVAQLDHLTGLANREGFDRQMSTEWQRALRYGRPLGLVFVDLDHFKNFNDTHGHVAGDRLLRETAAAITATARGSDFTARLGGDEFVVLCPETDPDGLSRLVERLRVEASGMAVSLSIGYAHQLATDEGPDDLVHRADESMYRAKGGRRRSAASGNPMLGSMRRG
jgi:diguanylate cyclase (GGDEF)-like protein